MKASFSDRTNISVTRYYWKDLKRGHCYFNRQERNMWRNVAKLQIFSTKLFLANLISKNCIIWVKHVNLQIVTLFTENARLIYEFKGSKIYRICEVLHINILQKIRLVFLVVLGCNILNVQLRCTNFLNFVIFRDVSFCSLFWSWEFSFSYMISIFQHLRIQIYLF